MLGYMMFNSLIFTLILYIAGFSLIAKDAEYSGKMDQIISYSWPSLCEKIFLMNYFVAFFFTEFIKDKKAAKTKFQELDGRFNLRKIEGEYKFKLVDNVQENLERNLSSGIQGKLEKAE